MEGDFGGCCEMMKGPRGGSATPRSDQITISTKINFASLSVPHPPNLTIFVEEGT